MTPTSRATRRAVPAVVEALASWGVTDVRWFLAYNGEPVLWLVVATDAERAVVAGQDCFHEVVRALLAEAGVEQDAAARALVTVESQETVDRDCRGDWFLAMK